jgi:hypothetical protein
MDVGDPDGAVVPDGLRDCVHSTESVAVPAVSRLRVIVDDLRLRNGNIGGNESFSFLPWKRNTAFFLRPIGCR